MGKQIGAATVENSMEISQKKTLKTELPYDPGIPLLGIYLKETKPLIRKDTYTTMFIAALFIIAKVRKQPKCPSTDEWIKKMWYIYIYMYVHITFYVYTYTMEYYSAIKRMKFCHFRNMDGLGGHYTKWNKSGRERQILYDITYMWNLKYDTNELIYKTETDPQT